jgi:hypothetical protein
MSFAVPRVRSRNDLRTLFAYRWEGDGYSDVRYISDWPSFSRIDTIEDVVNTRKTQRVKPVAHDALVYRGLPYQPFQADHGLWVRPLDGQLPFLDNWALSQDVFSIPHTERVQANSEAFIHFAERFPTKVSGAEFVQGLQELSALIPKLEKTITQTIAGAYLTKKFGWDNLLSDLNTFTVLVSSIRERMEFLKRTYGKPTKLYFRKPSLNTLEAWDQTYTPVRGFGTRLILSTYQCDYNASASLLQRLSHIDDLIGWLRAIVISLGFNNLLNSAWKTSRLSFVVDWFANVSGHLQRLATIQPTDQWDVFDVSHSVTLAAKFQVYQVNEEIHDGFDSETYLGSLTVKRYVRYVGLPVDLTVFTPSTATPDQLELLVAMMGAK